MINYFFYFLILIILMIGTYTDLNYGIIPNNLTIGNKNSVVNIIVPEIIPNKTVNIKNPILGDNVTYAVNVNNVGKVNATNVVVKDVLPERLKFISDLTLLTIYLRVFLKGGFKKYEAFTELC